MKSQQEPISLVFLAYNEVETIEQEVRDFKAEIVDFLGPAYRRVDGGSTILCEITPGLGAGGGFMMFYCPETTRYAVIDALSKFGGGFRRFNFINEGVLGWTVSKRHVF